MAPTSEAGLLAKDDRFPDENVSSASSPAFADPIQSLGDFDNSCETFFCRRNSPLLSRSVIPEPSSTFRKVLGDMEYESDEDDSNKPENNKTTCKNNADSSTLFLSTPSASNSKLSSTLSRKSNSTHSNFLSVPKSLPALTSSHADSSDYGAHKTLAGLSLRKNSSRRPASFGGNDSIKPEARFPDHKEKRVSWADERGTQHQFITVRLIRPRLSIDASIGISATPGQSILRRQE